MSAGITEFITKFSDRINVGPVFMGRGEWLISICSSDATDEDPDEAQLIDLTLAEAQRLAVAIYHAVCRAEEEMAR